MNTKRIRTEAHNMVAAERWMHLNTEGYTPAHDDGHKNGELLSAATAYLEAASTIPFLERGTITTFRAAEKFWPWKSDEFKPSSDQIRNLVKSAALICAEIDRLVRLEKEELSPETILALDQKKLDKGPGIPG